MIELRDVSLAYDDTQVLDHVDLEVEEAELVLVAGRTGVGKSSLLGVFNGLVPWFTGGTFGGDVLLDGRSIRDLPPRERADVVGYVAQDPTAGFVTDIVEEELAYGMEQLGVPAPTMRRRVEETLDVLGITDLRARDLRSLSGGQQQRVAIGSVLTVHPRLLVLDEPTSALDPTAAEDVLATLTRLVHDLGLSVVLAEHRLERVVPFADRLCVLTGDGGVRVGAPEEILLDAPVVPPIIELGRLAGWRPLPLSVRDARRAARLESPAPTTAPATTTSQTPTTGVRIHGLGVTYGRLAALREVDLELPAGQVTAVMGRNGSGKSSLLWALRDPTRRSGGSVDLPTSEGPAVGLVPQTASDLLYLESVAQECADADAGAGAGAGTTRTILDRLVPGIPDDRHPRDLSEGQRLALVLALVLVGDPPVVALDEPTRGLDYPAKEQLAAVVGDLARRGRTVVVATHDVEFAAACADRVVVLAGGEVISAGPTIEVISESPAFAPQVLKILGPPWLTVDQVAAARSQEVIAP